MEKRNQDEYSHVLKYTGVFGGVQGLNVLIGLVRNKFVAMLLGPGGMGLVSLFNTTVQLLSQATNLGISFSAVRHISEYYDAGETEKAEHYVKVVRGWCLLTALVGMLLCIGLGKQHYICMGKSYTAFHAACSCHRNACYYGRRNGHS